MIYPLHSLHAFVRSFNRLIIVGCFLMSQGLVAQQIKGVVYDQESKLPLSNVIVIFNAGGSQVLTDSSGRFMINIRPVYRTIVLRKLGFLTYNLKIGKDTLQQPPIAVYLTRKPVSLREVDVSSEKVNPVVKNKRFYIHDYFILPNKNVLLMTYYAGEKGFNVAIAGPANNILCQVSIPREEPSGFFLDCTGNLHALSDQYSRQVDVRSDTSFKMTEAVPVSQFKTIIEPCVAKIDKGFFFQQYSGARNFTREDVRVHVNSNKVSLYEISDNKYTPLKTVSYNKQLKAMQDEEVNFQNRRKASLCDGSPSRNGYSPYDILLAYDHIYRQIYAPVFTRQDTLLLFDFSQGEIDMYDHDGTFLKKVALEMNDFPQYHVPQLLQDRVSGKIYLLTKEHDEEYLHEINLYAGNAWPGIRLEKPLPGHVQVYDDDIYYIVREHDWDDTSYLYKQRR